VFIIIENKNGKQQAEKFLVRENVGSQSEYVFVLG
jgi:hypothetical protein